MCQTHNAIELIIIDDCSSDKTNEILDRYSQFTYVKILKNDQNCGVAYTRNRGIAEANGKYIAFLDADDEWLKEKCELQLKYMRDNKIDVCSTNYNKIGETGTSIISVPISFDFNQCCVRNKIGLSTVMLRSEIIKEHKFQSKIGHEDMDLWLRLLRKGYLFGNINEVLVNYFIMKNSRSSNKFRSFIWHFKVLRANNCNLITALLFQLRYIKSVITS